VSFGLATRAPIADTPRQYLFIVLNIFLGSSFIFRDAVYDKCTLSAMTPHEIWPKIKMSDLANALNMSRAGVYRWKENGRIPAERVLEVAEITGIARESLRPDLYEAVRN
jgi:hypothetical protein